MGSKSWGEGTLDGTGLENFDNVDNKNRKWILQNLNPDMVLITNLLIFKYKENMPLMANNSKEKGLECKRKGRTSPVFIPEA